MTEDLHIRTPPAFRRHLDGLAKARGTTISQTIRWAVMAAALPKGGVPTEQEILELLGEAARAGNVPAMRELRAYHRERAQTTDSPFAEFDQLAERRAIRGRTPK